MIGAPRSLRGRLVGYAALTMLTVVLVAAAIATWQIRAVTARALADAVRTRLVTLRDSLGPDGTLGSPSRVQRTATYFQVLDADGRITSSSPALSGDPPLLPFGEARAGVANPALLNLSEPDLDLAAMSQPQRVNGRTGAVIVAVDSQGFLDARQQLQTVILAGIPLVVLVSGALIWGVTGRALGTVTRLAEDADALSVSDGSQQLPLLARDAEIARLVAALNRMLTRLNQHYATNLATASETTHRLRTPLATLRAEAEIALMDDDPAAARTALQRIVTDVDNLNNVVNRLLSVAGGRGDVQNLPETMVGLTDDWRRQAVAQGRTIAVNSAPNGQVDRTLLKAVVDPLVENAVRHSSPNDNITVDVDVNGQDVRIRVVNRGDGVPMDVRGQLFQPWHGRAQGGLGLWLARESARAAGGDVWCEEPGPPLVRFAARLPAAR